MKRITKWITAALIAAFALLLEGARAVHGGYLRLQADGKLSCGLSITELGHAGGFLISEAEGKRSRENRTLVTGQNLGAGAVLGQVAGGTAATAFAGTGNGTITMDATTPVGDGAKAGAYTATCITAATDGGTFRVEDPDGFVLGDVAVGATFNDDIKFVINDGSTDFTVGAKFTITVVPVGGKVTVLAPTATDGTELPAGILWAPTDATSADKACMIIARSAEVNGAELVWPAGISATNKSVAIQRLAALGIIIR